MKKLLSVFFFTAMFLFIAGISYADISINVEIDKQNMALDDNAFLSVKIKGTRSSAVKPVISGGDAFRVVYSGSSSNVSMINGVVTSSVEFNYILVPKKTGTFNLPPITFTYQDEVYKTEPIKLIVTKPFQREGIQDIFVESEISNEVPYVNEQILFTFRFYSSVQVLNATFDSPDFDDFIVENLGDSKSYQKVINGKRYTINEVKYALFPLKPGEYTIPSISVSADIVYGNRRPSFFGGGVDTKKKYLQTNYVKLNVREIPEYKDEKVFFSNLVGDFKIDASLGKKSLHVGDSTTLTVTVYGYGNLSAGVFPAFTDLEDFKTYDDKPVDDIKITKGGLYGSKVLKRAFIPLKEGTLILPAVRFSYFDTKKGDYVVLSTPEYTLDVKPSLEKEKLNLVEMVGTTTTKEAVKIIGKDVLPINTSLDTLDDQEFELLSAINAVTVIFPGFVYLGFVFYTRRRMMHKADESILRKKRAYKKFTQSTGDMKKLIKNDSKEFYSSLLNSFKIYIGDKFNIVGSAMTSKELSMILNKENLKKDVIADIKDVTEKLERARFASLQYSDIEKKELFKKLVSLAKKIEKRVR